MKIFKYLPNKGDKQRGPSGWVCVNRECAGEWSYDELTPRGNCPVCHEPVVIRRSRESADYVQTVDRGHVV